MKKPLVIFILFFSLILSGFVFRGKISGEKFESEKWKTADLNDEYNQSLRWDMINNLRNNYNLVGMSKKRNY